MNENDTKHGDHKRTSRRRRGRGDQQRKNASRSSEPANSPRSPSLDSAAPAENLSYGPTPSIADRIIIERASRYRGAERAPKRDNERGGTKMDGAKNASGKNTDSRWPRAAQAAAEHPRKDRSRIPQRQTKPPLPKPLCPRCGKVIEDLSAAINDKDSGEPCHFDCVVSRIADGENLGAGEKVVYIGGGRFGVVYFEQPSDLKRFQIKKIIQWEDKEKRADWRNDMADRYSAT